jgi:hypothetical protein
MYPYPMPMHLFGYAIDFRPDQAKSLTKLAFDLLRLIQHHCTPNA